MELLGGRGRPTRTEWGRSGEMPVYMGGDGPCLLAGRMGLEATGRVGSIEQVRPKKPIVGVKSEAIRHPGYVVHATVQGRGVGNRR